MTQHGQPNHSSVKPDPHSGVPRNQYQPTPPILTPIRDVNDIVSRAFGLYRANFGPFVTIMALAYVGYFVIYALLYLLPLGGGISGPTSLVGQLGSTQQLLNSPALYLLVTFARTFLLGLPLVFASGALVVATTNAYFGRPVIIADSYRYAFGLATRLIMLALLSALLDFTQTLFNFIPYLNLAGIILYLALLIGVAVRWQVGRQALVLERIGAFEAVNRSWKLIGSDRRGMSFGLWFILAVRTVIPVVILWIVLLFVVPGGLTGGWFLPATLILFALLGLLVTPLFDSAFTIFYIHLRAEREGLEPAALLANIDAASADKKLVG